LHKLKDSISKFKTEKRKDYESKAAFVLMDVYRKHMFRKQLSRGIRERERIVKSLSNYCFFLRMRKFYICFALAKHIREKAYAIGKARKEQ
jgi:hypothetical protein